MINTNHICFSTSELISEISKPLFEASNLNYFSYGRVFDKNKCFVFHTNNAFIENWFKSDAPAPSCWPQGIYMWDDILTEDLKTLRYDLNLGNGICVVDPYENYTDIFAFNAPHSVENAMSIYLNQMNALNKFSLYFKDQASKLIQQGLADPLVIADAKLNHVSNKTLSENNKINERINALKIKNYYFNEKYNGIKLTKREVECLSLYLKGKTSHDIATSLSLNKKTIDTFLSLIKKKFDCRTRSELFEIIWDLGILKSNGWIKV